MSRIENYELELQIKWLWELLNRTPARYFDPVSDVLTALIEDMKMAQRAIEIAEQIWVIENAEENAMSAAEHLVNLMEWEV